MSDNEQWEVVRGADAAEIYERAGNNGGDISAANNSNDQWAVDADDSSLSARSRAAKRRGNNGNYGKKGLSGRKPSAVTVVKRRLQQERIDDAQYAMDLLTAWMKDEEQAAEFRRACASDVLDRVLGKPVQAQANGGDEAYRAHIESVRAKIMGGSDGADGGA